MEQNSISGKSSITNLVNAALSSHRKLRLQISQIEDDVVRMLPIYDQSKLEEESSGWCANWAFGKGKAQVEKMVTQSQQQIGNSFIMMSVDWHPFDKDKHKGDAVYDFLRIAPLRKRIGAKIVHCFLEAISKDERVFPLLMMSEFNSILYGYSCIEPKIDSYIGETVHRSRISFPPKSTQSNVKCWVITDTFSVTSIFETYKTLIKAHGKEKVDLYRKKEQFLDNWNVKELCSILERYYRSDFLKKDSVTAAREIEWEEVGIFLNSCDKYTFVNSGYINIARVSEITSDGLYCYNRYVTLSGSSSIDSEIELTAGEVLFNKKEKHTSLSSLCFVRDFSVSPTNYLNEISGSGITIAENSTRYNRSFNEAYNKFALADSIVMIPPSGGAGSDRAALSVGGGQIVLPQGWSISSDAYRPNLQNHISLLNMEESGYREVMSHVDPQVDLTSRPTKQEVSVKSAETISLRNTRLPAKLIGYSSWLSRSIKNLSFESYERGTIDRKIQDRFFRILEEEFSSMDLELDDIKKILGSIYSVSLRPVLSDIGAIKEALALAKTDESRAYLEACYLVAIGFNREDITLVMSSEYEASQLEVAAFENILFQTSSEIVFTQGQDHITHLNTHYAKADREFMSLQSGKDPVVVFNFVGNCLSNCEKHLEAIQYSPFYSSKFADFNAIHKEMVGRYRSLANYVNSMKKAAEKTASQEGSGSQNTQAQEEALELRRMEQELKFQEIAGMQKLQQKQALFEQRMAHTAQLKKAQSEISKMNQESIIKINQIHAASDAARKMTK